MKITVQQLLTADPAIAALWSQKGLRGRASLRIQRMVAKLRPEYELVRKSLDDVFLPESPESPGIRTVRAEKNQDVVEFMATEIEVDISPLTHEDISDAIITPEQCELLGPLLAE